MIKRITGKDLEFDDFSDVKKIIAKASNVKPDDVTDVFWPQMDIDEMLKCSVYMDNDDERYEIIELIKGILSIVEL